MKTLQNAGAPRHADAAGDITIHLSGAPRRVPAGTTLAGLLVQAGHEANAVSTAVNGEFVSRGQRESRVLGEGDAVLLFQPIVGG